MSRSQALPREAKLRANGLLDMFYTPPELAAELGVDVQIVYRKLDEGLPHKRDGRNHIWIHGPEVARWLRTFDSKWRATERHALAVGQAYCLRCRRAVTMLEPHRVKRGKFVTLVGICAECGAVVNRGVKAL